MQLWQMDVMGRVPLTGGQEVKIVTGIDERSRFMMMPFLASAKAARKPG